MRGSRASGKTRLEARSARGAPGPLQGGPARTWDVPGGDPARKPNVSGALSRDPARSFRGVFSPDTEVLRGLIGGAPEPKSRLFGIFFTSVGPAKEGFLDHSGAVLAPEVNILCRGGINK